MVRRETRRFSAFSVLSTLWSRDLAAGLSPDSGPKALADLPRGSVRHPWGKHGRRRSIVGWVRPTQIDADVQVLLTFDAILAEFIRLN